MVRRLVWLSLWCFGLLAAAAEHGLGGTFTVTAPAFAQGQPIPARYALAGENQSPELRIKDAPEKARTLALIVVDPDAPSGDWIHWLVWNLPADTRALAEGSLPAGAREGKNSFGHVRYDGPSPPSGTHRYFFRLYALDTALSLPVGSDRKALESAMDGHIVGIAETYGTYSASP
ncbi:MAG TPA: YbhB/YbcL family Raf kinase inhibitor-like protein [Candidatus Methylacidiphilales bacterium]|nr:YbhB/YbcL family Raf kinase inhibitor-like protein [Candidatus Methylacidiphilales bacterium]